MDFAKIKQKALDFKNKAIELKDKTINSTAQKIGSSSLVLKTQGEFDIFVLKSENTNFTNKEGVNKTFIKRCIVIFGDSSKNFFNEFLFSFPLLLTKGFSQNLPVKIVDIQNKAINNSIYNLEIIPSMIIFENKEIYKIISGEDNIKKIVKSFSLDINKTIEEM